jgi:hypothetical protein
MRAAEAVVTNAPSVFPSAPPIVTASRRGIALALTVARVRILVACLAVGSTVPFGAVLGNPHAAVISRKPWIASTAPCTSAPSIVGAGDVGDAPALTVSRIGVLITGLAPWSAVSRGTIVRGGYAAVVSFEPVFTDAEAIKTAASPVPGAVVKHVACLVALNSILVRRTY